MAQAQKSNQKKSPAPKATEQKESGVRRVAILGGNRIPFARSNTAYSKIGNQELLTSALRGLVDRYNLQGKRVGEVVAGAVIKHSRDFNLTREAALDRKSTRLNSSHVRISYAVFCLKKKNNQETD